MFPVSDQATTVLVARPASHASDLSTPNCSTSVKVAVCTASAVAPTARNFRSSFGKPAISVSMGRGGRSWKDRGTSAARFDAATFTDEA